MFNKINKNIDSVVALFKGMDRIAFKNLPLDLKNQLIRKTIKELVLISESGLTGSGDVLLKTLSQIRGKPTPQDFLDINSLLIFGKVSDELSARLKKEAGKLEIQDEINHFSRIMGLDQVIAGKRLIPVTTTIAFRQCKDFARFLWLVDERRKQKFDKANSEISYPFLTKQNAVITKTGALISERKKANLSILVSIDKEDEESLSLVLDVFIKFLKLFDIKKSVLLLDYFIFLIGKRIRIKILSIEEVETSRNESKIKILATGGFCIATRLNLKNFKNEVLKTISFPLSTTNSDLRSTIRIFERDLKVSSSGTSFFIFAEEFKNKMSSRDLLGVLNTPDRSGKILAVNNLKSFMSSKKLDILFAVFKPGSKIFLNKNNQSKGFSLSTNSLASDITGAREIIFEVAHLHADRNPSQTQFDTIAARNLIARKLEDSDFDGKFKDILMIDDYHVVNRLDYKKYFSELKKYNFEPDQVIPESSPLIRAIAIDVLKKLFRSSQNIFEMDGNLYLSLENDKVVELIQGLEKEEIIGCVLFDAAFSVFKKDTEGAKLLFKNQFNRKKSLDINQEIIHFYLKVKSPILRKNFMESLIFPFPKVEKLKADKSVPFLDLIYGKTSVKIVNVHEIFYLPQQVKVNALLKAIDIEPITTVYLDPDTKNISIEQSGVNSRSQENPVFSRRG